MRLWIRGGRLIDPSQGLDGPGDLVIAGGRIAYAGPPLPGAPAAARAAKGFPGTGGGAAAGGPGEPDPGGAGLQVLDARGLWVVPGLIDPHVHLRTPGETHKETLATGGAAAAAGGFTAVACMPNTRPPLDDAIRVEWLAMKAAAEAAVRVYVVAAATRGLAGDEPAPYAALKAAGAVAVSDDGRPIARAGVMARVLEGAAAAGLPVLVHAEEPELSAGGAMHAGAVAAAAGMPGIPATAEAVMVARDLLLAEQAGARLHVLHASAAVTLDLVRWGKARGIPVTVEVTPHHLLLCDEDVAEAGFHPHWKMNPPLRSRRDREALLEAVADGTVDAIATDHAPHHGMDKDCPFPEAAFGVVGLETALGLLLTHLVPRPLSPARLVELMAAGPARILGLPGGTLQPGVPADVTLIDPQRRWVVDPEQFASLGRNTPFAGWALRGRAVCTLVGGRVVFRLDGGPVPVAAGEAAAQGAAGTQETAGIV
ncbi:dihydroorotase [Thermaerobacter sp. PB12/4term]|uniref:dihydroorotase n=1 Tax=Thermaerobacter sp. PB12/4term TaxID=2293838 RepID=UPI000E328494|nr:dihydroorotase [Thermaerobacter sp. PB12/4term]QIA27831.1 dihydroorotase [Thermaerobacter sp. PB12/4term]